MTAQQTIQQINALVNDATALEKQLQAQLDSLQTEPFTRTDASEALAHIKRQVRQALPAIEFALLDPKFGAELAREQVQDLKELIDLLDEPA